VAALRGLRTKASCFASLLELDHPEPVDVQTLSVLYGEVFGEEQQSCPLLARVPTLDRPCGLVEKPLASGADSPYAEFVKALGAADWVREGLERFAPRAEGVCPFCGKPLAEDFAERVAQCFDEAWHRDFAALQAFQQSYAAACSRTLATLRRNLEDPPPGLDLSACRDKIRLLEQAVEANLKALEGKLVAPLSRVELTPLDGLVAEINAGIDRANDDIRRMNGAADLAARRRECMGLVRNLMALQARGCLESYRKSRAEAEAVMKAQAASKRELAGEYLRLTEEIAARRRACTGTREAADAINAGLRAAGFEGFVLRARPEEELYELVRPDGLPAESLSEGERCFVAFLYFCHLVRSGRDREGIAGPTAAVLDDPSAGLDGEARTACARLVRWMAEDCLLGRSGEGGPSLEQLFVFTHDADFHRLASAPLAHAPGVALFRVEKRRNASSIVPQTGAGLPAQAEQNGLPRP
jgi:wobble nucleotide-excising tRNase